MENNVDIIAILKEYGWGVIFAYLILERMFPIIARALDKIIPAQIKRRMLIEEAKLKKRRALEEETLELEKQKIESEERLIDLREREVLAMEDIAKHLILLTTNLKHIDDRLDMSERTTHQVAISLATANQTLAILLDRSNNRRRDYIPPKNNGGTTQPVKTIKRKNGKTKA